MTPGSVVPRLANCGGERSVTIVERGARRDQEVLSQAGASLAFAALFFGGRNDFAIGDGADFFEIVAFFGQLLDFLLFRGGVVGGRGLGSRGRGSAAWLGQSRERRRQAGAADVGEVWKHGGSP